MTKIELFSKELQTMSSIFKALGHPARLAILQYLAETKTCISGDISDQLPLSRTTISQHLKELKTAGLIQGEIEGIKTHYCLCNSKISEYKKMLDAFLSDISSLDLNC